MEVHGRCHCGQIEFVTQSEPRSVICHCTDCQIMSGGPYRAITQTSEDDFRLTKGVLKKYYKTGDSVTRGNWLLWGLRVPYLCYVSTRRWIISAKIFRNSGWSFTRDGKVKTDSSGLD